MREPWSLPIAAMLAESVQQIGRGQTVILLQRVIGQRPDGIVDDMTRLLVSAMEATYGAEEIRRRFELEVDDWIGI